MAEYDINKGIDREIELFGLRAQYLYLFAGGLFLSFLLFVILYLSGIRTGICILAVVLLATVFVWSVIALNRRYGCYGVTKMLAARRRPSRIIRHRSMRHIIKKIKNGK